MDSHLNIAIKAALEAGKIIMRALPRLHQIKIETKGENDFVTSIDKNSEAVILDVLQHAYPKQSFLTEETGQIKGQYEDEVWIIDPIDGTHNFIYGLPQFCISIAFQKNNQLKQAVIYDPYNQDLYAASQNEGATLNDKRIRVSRQTQLKQALLGTGFPERNKKQLNRSLKAFSQVYLNASDTRQIGSAALNLAYVASGKLDGYWEDGLKPWDVAAGMLLVKEAGGYVTDFSGKENSLDNGEIIAGNPKVYMALKKELSAI